MSKFTTTLSDRAASCRGSHHNDSANIATCDKCGATVTVNDKGHVTNYDGYYTCWAPRHECDARHIESKRQQDLRARAAGEITKHAAVEVFKGRKVPVGTVGIVFWTGRDSYGNDRVGIKDADGNNHYTNAANVRLAEGVQEADQAELAEIEAAYEAAEAAAKAAAYARYTERWPEDPDIVEGYLTSVYNGLGSWQTVEARA